jgi:hypothetical protein
MPNGKPSRACAARNSGRGEIGRARQRGDALELRGRDATGTGQVCVHLVTGAHAAHDELDREIHPTPLVRDERFDGFVASGEALQVFRDHELGGRDARANRFHRQQHAEGFVHERASEAPVVIAQVRVPRAVQRGEARGRERFVDRSPAPYPRKCTRDRPRIARQQFRKRRIEQVRVRRPASVVQQGDDRLDAEFR